MKGLFVSGTDTNVGKTLVAAALLKALPASLQARYWKPIQTGEEDDTQTVRQLSGRPPSDFLKPFYHFPAPRSPHLAARAVGQEIDLSTIARPSTECFTIVEGAGGLLVPLAAKTLQIDLISKFELPVLLVAADKLGAINHTLLSLEACRQRGIEVIAIVLNRGGEHFGNAESLREFGEGTPVLLNPEAKDPEVAVSALAGDETLLAVLRKLFQSGRIELHRGDVLF